MADQWLGLAIAYVMQKHKCPMPTALRVVGEVQADLKASIPAAEVRAVPLNVVLELPAELQGR